MFNHISRPILGCLIYGPTWPDRSSIVQPRVKGLLPRLAPETLRPQLKTTPSALEAENMIHFDSMPPTSLGIYMKLFWMWEFKIYLAEGSVRCSQETFTIRWVCQACQDFFPARKSNLPLSGDQLKAQPTSSIECLKHKARGQMKRQQQSHSLTSWVSWCHVH